MPIPVVTGGQMRELDRATIDDIGIPGAVLMENAGRGTFEELRRRFPDALQRGAVVLCGRGNNGGDGFVVARCLHNAGVAVRVCLLGQAAQVGGDAALNLQAFVRQGGDLSEITGAQQWGPAAAGLAAAGLVVDGLLGTGLSAEVAGLYRQAIEALNAAPAAVVALDIPSGIDAATGRVLGAAVRADLTCTYGLPKLGLVVYPGAEYAGAVKVIDIGIPPGLVAQAGIASFLLDRETFRGMLAPRRADTHKGTYGHVCVLAGSPGKTGAAALAATAALRAGTGLVTLGTAQSLNAILEAKVTEVMTAPLPEDGSGLLGPDSLPAVRKLLENKTVLALGPGLGAAAGTQSFVRQLLETLEIPAVIDADGLNLLGADPVYLKTVPVPLVLTPHPGEMARLTGMPAQAVQADRIECARRFAGTWGVYLVLKGARTVIADPGGRIWISPAGSPGMASGGMGDVLTGMIAGLLAQGLDPAAAAQLGVYAHGSIGERLAAERGGFGVLAADMLDHIPKTLALLTSAAADAGGSA